MAIDPVNLTRIDLNLLVHLDALLTERSVTRAAARVHLGQSAMSHNLARLRELFSDVSLLWHASYDHDPAHAWLRQIVARLIVEL